MSNIFSSSSKFPTGFPEVLSETVTELSSNEQGKVRYQELSKFLREDPTVKKAKFMFQWKHTNDAGFDPKNDTMEAVIELNKDETLELTGEGWEASITSDGKIDGTIPDKLVEFLKYKKIDRKIADTKGDVTDITFYVLANNPNLKHTHSVEFIRE